MVKVIIVGSQKDKWNIGGKLKAIRAIARILDKYNPKQVLVGSGECPNGGIDKWVERLALGKGFTFIGYPPEVNAWNDKWIPYQDFIKENPHKVTTLHNWKCIKCGMKRSGSFERNQLICPKCGIPMYIRARGYKYRNTLMAKEGEELYSIDPKGVWSGGRWTIRHAKKLGKIVHQIEIDQ